jgi:hypothetical protein
MGSLRLVCCLAVPAAAAACQTLPPARPAAPGPKVVVEEAEAWRSVASARDTAALDGLAGLWRQALAAGRAANLTRRIATELRGLRLGGYLWEQKGGERLVFLGAAVPAGGRTATAYGGDPARDAAGLFERIGEFRYRLTLPEPSPGAGLTVVELVAAPRA